MRPTTLVSLPVLAVAAAGFVWGGEAPVPEPRFANIVAACAGQGTQPSVRPNRVLMNRVDSIVWREQTGRSSRFVISPKNPENWLFDQQSFTGTPQSPARTRRPSPGAAAGVPYAYNVTITCSDGRTQIIDPDIVIGEDED